MSQRGNEAEDRPFQALNGAKVRFCVAICALPVGRCPIVWSFRRPNGSSSGSIFKGPYGHYMDDAHAHEVCVYIKVMSAVLVWGGVCVARVGAERGSRISWALDM